MRLLRYSINNMFTFACLHCHTPLEDFNDREMRCPDDGFSFNREDGIWHCLLPERAGFFEQFTHEYEQVRRGEGRGSDDPDYYRALPFEDLSGQMVGDWHIRALSFMTLLEKVIKPLETKPGNQLKILDLGAGNGWLSYQLARRGHHLAAIDLIVNDWDGLGVHKMYNVDFLPIQAEYDQLPLDDDQADLVIFNASFHYTTNYLTTLKEAWRVAMDDGLVVVMDSAVYHDPTSGEQMILERENHFFQRYGFPSNAIPSQNYLTYDLLKDLANQLDVYWLLFWPIPAWRWTIRRLRARLRGHREPAQFPLILGQKAKHHG